MHSSHLMAAGPSSSFQNHIGCNCLGTYDLKTQFSPAATAETQVCLLKNDGFAPTSKAEIRKLIKYLQAHTIMDLFV